MDEEEKKTAEEQTEETKPEEQPAEPQEPEETPAEEEAQEDTPAEEDAPPEPEPEAAAEEPTPPEQSTEQQLREENFRLKTQLEAMKLGFLPDVIEDAVVLAENVSRRDGVEITEALAAVAKKYPAWKAGAAKGGIKIGADHSAASKKENKQTPASKRWNRTNH